MRRPGDMESTEVHRSADSPDRALLTARRLSCTLAGRVLWQDISLDVAPGARWAISGPSGCGKSVLLRTLAGLVPHEQGEIRLYGKAFEQWWPPAYRAQVVYVSQRPALAEGTVESALAAPFGLRAHRGRSYSRDAARQYLERIGLDGAFLQQDTGDLSGGEAQVAAVLRALLLEPGILLLDEPTASLDSTRAMQIEALIREWLAGSAGRAYVWTSHDAAQLARVTDRGVSLGGAA